MNLYTVIAILLIVAGILGLAYGQFSYIKESHGARLGPIDLTINEKQTVNIPIWAGMGFIGAGAGVMVFAFKKRQ